MNCVCHNLANHIKSESETCRQCGSHTTFDTTNSETLLLSLLSSSSSSSPPSSSSSPPPPLLSMLLSSSMSTARVGKTQGKCNSPNAFVMVHFGGNLKYLELELYTLINLRDQTAQDTIYLYSVNDTPASFIEAVRPFVTEALPYDDRLITFGVSFDSHYSHFNMIRGCNYIFAHQLTQYQKICIIESDMIFMTNLDEIFLLNSPAMLCYSTKLQLNQNVLVENDTKTIMMEYCDGKSRCNGGVILFEPSLQVFELFKTQLLVILKNGAVYPNEFLFELTHLTYFNMPVRFNLSHYHLLHDEARNPVYVYHFNETIDKHLDLVKKNILHELVTVRDRLKKVPVTFFKLRYYDVNKDRINALLESICVLPGVVSGANDAFMATLRQLNSAASSAAADDDAADAAPSGASKRKSAEVDANSKKVTKNNAVIKKMSNAKSFLGALQSYRKKQT